RVRVGLRRRLEQLFGTLEASSAESTTPGGSSRSPSATGRGPQAGELYPYLGGLLEVALEHEAEARTSQLSPEALQWRTFEVVGPLGDADGELLAALVAPATLPAELERRVLEAADGNPFFLEELVRSLADVGALVRTDDGWRFDHAVEVEVPPTVEKAILARLDRLSEPARDLVTAASALGRTFALPLLEGVLGDVPADSLHELQR